MIPVLAALAAAVSFAVAAVLQQEAAQTTAEDVSLSLRLLQQLLHRPRWLAGVLLLVTGYGLQAVALANGPVALVQPIVATELAFAIPLGIWRKKRRAGRREWLGIAAVVSGVSVFLVVAAPVEGISQPGPVDWIVSLGTTGAVIAVLLGAGRVTRGPHRATLLGAAAGLSFGLLAVITKSLTGTISEGAAATFTSWQLYAVIGLGIGALIVSQSAYQAGPLALALPPISLLEPLIAVLIGDTVLGEQAHLSGGSLAVEIAAASVAAAGIVTLATSRTVLAIYAGAHPESAG